MGLGTAVFLGSILISLVLLFGFTRDRWRWKRIVALGFAGVLLLVVLGAVFISWMQHREAERIHERAERQRLLHAVEIGDHFHRVVQRQGRPDTILPSEDGKRLLTAYHDLARRDWARIFAFDEDSSLTEMQFFSNKVVLDPAFSWLPEDGVTFGATREDVFSRLGEPCLEEIGATDTYLMFPTSGTADPAEALRTFPEAHGIYRTVHIQHGKGTVSGHGWYRGTCSRDAEE